MTECIYVRESGPYAIVIFENADKIAVVAPGKLAKRGKYQLGDFVRIKTIAPQYPRHICCNVISNHLISTIADGRIVAVDGISAPHRTLYEVDFRCFDRDHMRLTVDEDELSEICV